MAELSRPMSSGSAQTSYRQKTMSSLFFRDCYLALGEGSAESRLFFPSTSKLCWLERDLLLGWCFNAVLATDKGLIMPAEAMSFLFCNGSCKQSTRNFPHTCETSTESNTVISRLASAVRNGTPVGLDRLRLLGELVGFLFPV